MSAVTQGELLRTLPFARRYARALTGSQQRGDALVAQALRAGLPPDAPGPIALFAGVSRLVPDSPGEHITAKQRQLLLLTALEDLSVTDAALAVGLPVREAHQMLDSARNALLAVAATDIMVIEDEPIIAMDIRQLVENCGHNVVGIASGEAEAVAMARELKPGLILADVNLGPGGDGISAVQRILKEQDMPVIFVTAYPERLLTAEHLEPAFIISKPFEPVALAIATYQAVSGGLTLD
ncbi:response regulator [Roseomonas xinghualingensis]|uniref:response regulator n=1 Tax=Roseomonas xinghualingensis TaxID=2986475 RepID=UPI0021F24986|nr:response regulator [Roseomonas sp. SXEYE001]MCV4208941.1 response regulator [Roseomonas sp. SXEYE001]